jgi:hypothetical protein
VLDEASLPGAAGLDRLRAEFYLIESVLGFPNRLGSDSG